jgi:hypothetical protein
VTEQPRITVARDNNGRITGAVVPAGFSLQQPVIGASGQRMIDRRNAVRLHARHGRAWEAVDTLPTTTTRAVAKHLRLDYDQTHRLLTDLAEVGFIARADTGVWTALTATGPRT